METITISNGNLIFKDFTPVDKHTKKIPLTKVVTIEAREKLSFAHPVIGFLIAFILTVISYSILLISIIKRTYFVFFRTGIWFLLLGGLYLFWSIYKSKKIPWILIHTHDNDYSIPVPDATIDEVNIFIKQIKNNKVNNC